MHAGDVVLRSSTVAVVMLLPLPLLLLLLLLLLVLFLSQPIAARRRVRRDVSGTCK